MRFFLLSLLFLALFSFSSFGADCQASDQQPCGYSDVGECEPGIQVCEDGFWSMCYGGKGPVPEICNDRKDNDCDGEIDEQCSCTAGETRVCGPTETIGICQQGTETCIDGEWGPCENAVFPFPSELCGQDGFGNQVDDDCNGQVDEGCKVQNATSSITCFNGKQDADEGGIDCGGPCKRCASCDDRVLNQGEEKVSQDLGSGVISDCGGSHCPSCPSCSDGVKNQKEQGIDCGGPCAGSCEEENSVDTDHDGVPDDRDPLPHCPDQVCQRDEGETSSNCDDCTSAFPKVMIALGIFVFIGAAAYFYLKRKMPTSSPSSSTKPSSSAPYALNVQAYKQLSTSGKKRTTALDDAVDKSFQKVDKFLKK